MNKKGLSILLALSMVFSLNTFAFAEEAVATEEAIVETTASEEAEVQYDYEGDDDKKSIEEEEKGTQSADDKKVSVNGTTINAYVGNSKPTYTGSKITAATLNIFLQDTGIEFDGKHPIIPVKKIKITDNKKATATGTVKYKITGIYNWKYMQNVSTAADAKSAYKAMKSKVKSIKDTEFLAYVQSHWISSSVSMAKFKEMKKNKTLSEDDLYIDADGDGYNDYIGNTVIITTKNGSIKKVQLPVVNYKYTKQMYTDGSTDATGFYSIKLKLKTLKKGTDYTVSGAQINFKGSSSFSGYGGYSSKD